MLPILASPVTEKFWFVPLTSDPANLANARIEREEDMLTKFKILIELPNTTLEKRDVEDPRRVTPRQLIIDPIDI